MLAVALFVYDRPDVLERTLTCLRDAGFDALHVFSDGPRDARDAEAVGRVRELVHAVDWAEITVHERDGNAGLSTSIVEGVEHLLGRHERVVAVEDDVWVAPEFGRFVEAALDAYEGDERVAGVTGLRLPFSRRAFRGYPHDAFLQPRFSSWGWATWRRAWRTWELDTERLRRRVEEAGARLEVAGDDVREMAQRLFAGELRGAWDVRCTASMVLNGQHFVAPTWNMVENGGFGGGTHHRKPPPFTLRWETEHRPDLGALRFPAGPDGRVTEALRRFTAPPRPRPLDRARGAARRLLRGG